MLLFLGITRHALGTWVCDAACFLESEDDFMEPVLSMYSKHFTYSLRVKIRPGIMSILDISRTELLRNLFRAGSLSPLSENKFGAWSPASGDTGSAPEYIHLRWKMNTLVKTDVCPWSVWTWQIYFYRVKHVFFLKCLHEILTHNSWDCLATKRDTISP